MSRMFVAACAAAGLCFACVNVVGDPLEDAPRDGEVHDVVADPGAIDEPIDEPADDSPPPVDEPPPPVDEPPPVGYVPPDLAACANGPLDAPINNCAPSLPPSTGDPHRDCVDRINQMRWECQCMQPLARWTDGESCADRMAEDDHDSGQAHGASSAGLCDWGFGQNECPSWGDTEQCIEGCIQMMWDEGPGSFFGGHGHYINMTSSDHKQVACGFFEGSNGAWSVQNFR